MSSRFVSAGAIDLATGETVAVTDPRGNDSKRKQDWSTVSQELEDQRLRRAEDARRNAEGGEPSLFAILQANKAAKQAELEEASKIKNQFRPLDEDEIEFLDEIAAAKRTEEERTRREVEDGLDRFRELQKVKNDSPNEGMGADSEKGLEDLSFRIGSSSRKRRRRDETTASAIKGVLRRKISEDKKVEAELKDSASDRHITSVKPAGSSRAAHSAPSFKEETTNKEVIKTGQPPRLVAYGSDDENGNESE